MKEAVQVPILSEFIETHKEDNDKNMVEAINLFLSFPIRDDSFKVDRTHLRDELRRRVDDVIMSYRYTMNIYNNNLQRFLPIFEEEDRRNGGMYSSILRCGSEEAINYGRHFITFNKYIEIRNALAISKEGLIIQLWAAVEQFSKRALVAFGINVKDDLSWTDGVEHQFFKCGIKFKSISSYKMIKELRVVNNKIKHLYRVDEQLAKYDGFKEHLNKPMVYVDYKVHDYTFAVYHFFYSVISEMGDNTQY